jgi:hypothetical protein
MTKPAAQSCSFMATFFHSDGSHTSKFFNSICADIAEAKAQIDEIYSEPCTIYCFKKED